jgi:processive 1,2-diacylglycerol beta-glucosyltransferase
MMGHAEEARMVQLFDNEVDVALGTISEEQLQFLQGKLEKPPATIDKDTLNMFERDGADPALLTMLRGALGTRDEMEIRWHRL